MNTIKQIAEWNNIDHAELAEFAISHKDDYGIIIDNIDVLIEDELVYVMLDDFEDFTESENQFAGYIHEAQSKPVKQTVVRKMRNEY
jgi:hypothetical protein